MLAELGAEVIDADAVAHEVMRAGTPTWQHVVDEFGQVILRPDGEIDRVRLGNQVFANPADLARLEAIVHPAVIAAVERRLQELQDVQSGARPVVESVPGRPRELAWSRRVAVLEAIKLVESGIHERCDELWVVTCTREQQIRRLMEARGLGLKEAEVRVDAQTPQNEKVGLADVVIDNSGDLERTRLQVRREWERIVSLGSDAAVLKSAELGSDSTFYVSGGAVSSLLKWMDEHPFLSMWVILGIGMVVIFLATSREVDMLPRQRLFMSLACVVLAGLCAWIASWE